jgi:hypothetical protein
MTDPADHPLLDFLLAVLTAVMAPALNNVALARRAAQQAIEAYQPQGTYELIATGQILAFAMTALEALRLAAPQDVSPSMQLKLRGNANGLNRAARDTTRILDKIRETAAAQASIAAWQEPEPPAPQTQKADAPTTTPPPTNEPQDRPDWAAAMHRVAAGLRASTPPAGSIQRTVNALWIGTLNGVAQEITQSKHQPANSHTSKADLLRTTLLAGDPRFPPLFPLPLGPKTYCHRTA